MAQACPYCNTRPIIRKATCGSAQCQMAHHKKQVDKNWKKKGDIYSYQKKVREYRSMFSV